MLKLNEIILESILKEVFEVLLISSSNYETSYLLQLLKNQRKERKYQKERKEGYPDEDYLRNISHNLCNLIFKENLLLYSLSMPGINENIPINDNMWKKLSNLIKRIQFEVKIVLNKKKNKLYSLIHNVINLFVGYRHDNQIKIPLLENDANEEKKLIIMSKELFSELIDTFNQLGLRGILYILGVRTTIGSVDIFPPSRQILINAFNLLHTSENNKKSAKTSSILTVGARALCKHSHRSLEGFWGNCVGSESVKNKIALDILDKLFNNCVWINMHQMCGTLESEFILEVRVKEGYGARWACCNKIEVGVEDRNENEKNSYYQRKRIKDIDVNMLEIKFRGFVEPMMLNGHEVGWKH